MNRSTCWLHGTFHPHHFGHSQHEVEKALQLGDSEVAQAVTQSCAAVASDFFENDSHQRVLQMCADANHVPCVVLFLSAGIEHK
jgi:hypothetical protein